MRTNLVSHSKYSQIWVPGIIVGVEREKRRYKIYPKIMIQANDASGGECQTSTVRQGVPVPELAKHNHPNDRTGVSASSAALQADGDVPTTSIDETLSYGSAEAGHWVFMFIRDNFGIFSTSWGDGWRGSFRLFDKNHAKCDERPLPNKVNAILGHWFQNFNSIL